MALAQVLGACAITDLSGTYQSFLQPTPKNLTFCSLFAQLPGPTLQSPKDLLFNSEAYKATYQESLFSSFINNSYPPQRHTSDIYLVTVFIKEDSPAKKPLPEESTEHIYSLELTLKFGHAKHVRIHTVIDIAPSLPERSTAEKALIHKAFLIPNKMR